MRTVIIDDEFYAIEGLKHELNKFEGIEVVNSYTSCNQFLEDYPGLKPDLVFTDIEMPDMGGFELLRRICEFKDIHIPHIVFVTAYEEYAIKAFEVNAMDYLVKPVNHDRLKKTVERLSGKSTGMEGKLGNKNIQIKTFGNFGVYVDGEQVPLKWRSKKTEELFIYLLINYEKYVSKDKIAGDLWPELNSERSKSNLYLCLYYLKQTMSQFKIEIDIESIRGKLRLSSKNLKCDFLEFNRLEVEVKKKQSKENVDELKQLCNYYKGPFLDGYYYEWNEINRQHYEVQTRKFFNKLCDLLEITDSDKLLNYKIL